MTCIAGVEHKLDRNRVCSACGEYIPAPPLLMTKTDTGSKASYAEPKDDSTPYILTECSKCNLKQKLYMEGFDEGSVRMQSILIGWNTTECCGAPMMTEVHGLEPKESA